MGLKLKSDKTFSGELLPHYAAFAAHKARVLAGGGTIPSEVRCQELLSFLMYAGFDLADCFVYGAEFGIAENAGAITKFFNPANDGGDALVTAGTVTKDTTTYSFVTAQTSNGQKIQPAAAIPINSRCILAGAAAVGAPGNVTLMALNPNQVFSSTETVAQIIYNDTSDTTYGYMRNDTSSLVQTLSSVPAVAMDGNAFLATGVSGSIYVNGVLSGTSAYTSKKLAASLWANIIAGASTNATLGAAVLIRGLSATDANAATLSNFLKDFY